MSTKLGAAFLRCAMGPLNYAGGCILSGKVADGLRELTADNLHGGYRRGVDEAARDVGVESPEIERLLPVADIVVAAARINAAQAEAVKAWSTYAGQIGGLLAGVGDLTVDGRAPDTSACLERLSKKVVRDPPLSEPLHNLAVAVGRWTDLVEQSSDLLAGGDVLAKAYRARRIRRATPLVALAVVVVAAVPWLFSVRARRARIDGALAATDACAAVVSPADLAGATDAQRARAILRGEECAARQRAEAEAQDVARAAEAKAKAREQQRRDHEARCAALADHLAAGNIQPEDGDVAGGKEPLLVRIAHGTLAPEDMKETTLPCADAPSAGKVSAAFSAAVLRSPAAWANAEDIAPWVAEILIAHRAEIGTAPKFVLVANADKQVKRAMFAKTPSVTEAAARICKLKDDLDARGGRYCLALAALRASGKL